MRIRAGIALCIALTALVGSTATADAATSCAVSTSSSSYAQAVAGTAGLVGYWRLGDGSGSVACDSLGLNSGSYQGGVTLGVPGAIAGDSNTAASFDGSTGNVSVPAASSLNVGDSFTVEAWVKRGSIGGSENQVVASKQNSAWVLMFNPSNQLVLRRSNVADIAASTTTLTDTSSWHDVAVTKSGSAVHLYIDGKDVTGSVSNQTLPDNTMPLAIGQSSTSAYFNGGIDEVALYTGALTASQVQNHYSLGTQASTTPPPTQPPPPTNPCAVTSSSSSYAQSVAGTSGIVGYWRLGDSGSVTCDSLGLNSGSYQGGVTLGVPGAIAGDSNTAASFDGSTGNASVPAASSLNVGDSFTVEAWVKRGLIGGSANQTIASKQSSAWVLMFNPSNQLVLRQSGVADIAASATTLTDTSSWHQVAVTKSGSAVHLYIDGKDVTGSVSNQTLPDNTQPLAIGQSLSSAYFSGGIDEVALYKGALTASQLQSHYSLGAPATTPPPPPTQPPPTSTDPTIAAAGDIACDPSDPDYNNGVGTSIDCQQMAVSNVLQANLAAVLALGDDQYDYGTLSAFNTSFNPSWGRFKSIMHPVPGNHEYGTSGAKGYFDYFDGVGSSTGIAGNRSQGYYSFNVGAWHIIALNSNCSSVGGCSSGSPQEKWLRSDLAAHTNKCTLAYWHHPRWTSGGEAGGNSTFMSPMVTDLYNANADLILSGHDHDYERFAPQNPSGAVDTTRGIREIVVGTGGESHHDWGTIQPNSQIRNNTAFGVLNLTLHSTSYDWQFISAAGSSFSDSGTASCH